MNTTITSQKYANFIRESMRDKPVEAIAGINSKSAFCLHELQYDYAYQLYGLFLAFNMDETAFKTWLQEEVKSMTEEKRNDCYNCLKDWSNKNL
jgi:hypothetical protein